MQAPLGSRGLAAMHLQQAGRLAWLQAHLEGVQRARKAFADRFDIRFFAGPAVEEGLRLVGFGYGRVGSLFGGGKKPFGHMGGIGQRPYLFDIDPNVAPPAKCKQGQASSMREVKLQVTGSEGWFTLGSVDKPHCLRRLLLVITDEAPQQATAVDVLVTVVFKVKFGGAGLLVGRKEGGHGGDVGQRPCQPCTPDM